MVKVLYTVGYGLWPVATRSRSLVEVLRKNGVTLLVDIRISPCASDVNPESKGPYRAQKWHLQRGEAGIRALLSPAGISYLWLVELGNPQKNDPEMTVFREHLRESEGQWPAQRGLRILKDLVDRKDQICCLMCACGDVNHCHRKLAADEFCRRYAKSEFPVELRHLRADGNSG